MSSTKHLSEKLTSVHKLFQGIYNEGIHPNLFCEASIQMALHPNKVPLLCVCGGKRRSLNYKKSQL